MKKASTYLDKVHSSGASCDIAVIIPTHNRKDLLERTIDSVIACNCPQDLSLRMLVIENGGQFGVEDLISAKVSWLPIEYRYLENGNKSAALNSVLDDLDDSLVIFLDDDVRVCSDMLIHYAEALAHNPEGYFFGGPMLIDYDTPPPEWLIDYLPVSVKGWCPETYVPAHPGVLWFMGCNWAAFVRDIKRAGGFDPKLGPGSPGTGQETAMQQALVATGVKPVYVPGAVVWHYVPESRCSVEWAIERAFKNGFSDGLTKHDARQSQSVFGVPRWMIRQRIELTFRSLFKPIFGNKRESFEARRSLKYLDGVIKGIFTAKKST